MSKYDELKAICDQMDVFINECIDPSSVEFKTWKDGAERFLVNAYGVDGLEYKKFKELRFFAYPSISSTYVYDIVI